MLDALNTAFMSRFAALSVETQNRVIEAIDAGRTVESIYDADAGLTSCLLAADPVETLWAAALSEEEITALGEALLGALSGLDGPEQEIINEARSQGGRVLVKLSHTNGEAQILMDHGGQVLVFGKLQSPPASLH